MSTLGKQECDFINVTGEPDKGRDARRLHVRRTVMTNYHKRKCQKKTLWPREDNTETSQVTTQAARPTSACQLNTSSTDPIRGDISLAVASSSFQLKTNTSPMHSRTCPIIIRFLSGQVIKAVRTLHYVSFIHHNMPEAYDRLDDPLMACREVLCSHYSSKTPHLPTLWHKVSIAQEHIYGTCVDFDKWQLLSSAQAITLYILARFRDSTIDGVFPGMDIALLYTLGKLFQLIKDSHMHGRIRTHKRGPHPNPTSHWKDWIFHESVNRTAIIYFLLKLVASIDFGIDCDEHSDWSIEGMLLPSAKAFWEARDEVTWKTWACVDGDGDQPLPALRIGNLVGTGVGSSQKAQIAAWQEESCEFGMVVMLASQLLMDSFTDISNQ
ncbi:hypothetical protein EDD37DRAFT_606624 [Exophiala viscosa]|uniref:uncharacterized protein n=1 Tax=Exophiala viscosa TaxID=2486360 RepID=UPI0021A10B9C|nr:hypothetical protein EDD37DRAFT_606624 [Exophiala viscosa]